MIILDTTPKLEELRNDLTSMIRLYMDPLPVGQKYVDLRLAMWNYWQQADAEQLERLAKFLPDRKL